jgi:hypothetical protein
VEELSRSDAHVHVPRKARSTPRVRLRVLTLRHLVEERDGHLPLLKYCANSIAHLFV